LITARVARNIHHGIGYRFNADGPVVDAVTPLGWAYVLAPFANTPSQALAAAQILGAVAWLGAAAFLGRLIAATGSSGWRFLPLMILACNAPLAAWGGAGMETGVITALATFALGDSRWTPLFAGVAAAWRPELAPWAFTLCVGRALVTNAGPRRVLSVAFVTLGPPLLVGLARQIFFGTSVPLGLQAKPSDLSHGAYYIWGAVRFLGAPLLLLSFRKVWRLAPRFVVVLVASTVHFAVVLGLGGDWMPFFRLLVPVLPGMLWVAAALANASTVRVNLMRGAFAVASSGWLASNLVPDAREVGAIRARLTERVAPLVERSDRVAALDIGWIGAATEATIIDLAGVTEPRVARLSGGHTSKRLPEDFVRSWQPSVLILLTSNGAPIKSWRSTQFARAVEERIATLVDESEIESITPIALGSTGQKYAVVRLRMADTAH
jgi:hypothetical protein